MGWLQSILYGFVSGITEFLPVSSGAHQEIMHRIFGISNIDPIRVLLTHIGLLLGILFCNRNVIVRYRREARLAQRYSRSNNAHPQLQSEYELRLIKTAAVPMAMTMLLSIATRKFIQQQLLIMLLLLRRSARSVLLPCPCACPLFRICSPP